jgi:Ca2+-binding RTX toxin-like protein
MLVSELEIIYMSLFGKLNIQEFATVLRTAVAAFGKADPPNGWDELKMSELHLDDHGTTFTTRNGRGKAIVVEAGDQLIVSFRGSDKFNDYKDYGDISLNHSYFKQFQPLLKQVAKYAEKHDSEVTFTGISLGAAVVNIIADRSDTLLGKAFQDSHFVGISSPYLSGSHKADVYNFGFGNDAVYHVSPHSWGSGARQNATKHLFVYENHKHFKTDNIDDRLSVHSTGNVGDAVKSLVGLTLEDGQMLVDKLNQHSYVLFDDTKEDLHAGRLTHPYGTPLTVIGEDRGDRLSGATEKNGGGNIEWFFGRGGNDRISAHGGNDKLFGGGGDDYLVGGAGADYMSGGLGEDTIFLETHRDRASGDGGADRFMVRDILPLSDHGNPSVGGKNAARLFIEDFQIGNDVLNLRAIDGNLAKRGDQPLHFAGYFRYDATDGLDDLEKGFVNDRSAGSVTIFEDQHGDTRVIINRDEDRGRELEIVLTGDIGDIHHDILF